MLTTQMITTTQTEETTMKYAAGMIKWDDVDTMAILSTPAAGK